MILYSLIRQVAMRHYLPLVLIFIAFSANASFKDDLENLIAERQGLEHVVAKFYNGKGLSQSEDIKIISLDIQGNKFDANIQNIGGRNIPISGRFYSAILMPAFKRNVKAGEVINSEDIIAVKVASGKTNNQYVNLESDLLDKATRVNIASGKPIKKQDVINPIVVTKGDNVKAMYIKNNLSIEVLAQALESGGIGDFIRVKNLDSNQNLQAKILDSQTVRIGQ
jgi:flagella basal body P-ring formation protein FlgA